MCWNRFNKISKVVYIKSPASRLSFHLRVLSVISSMRNWNTSRDLYFCSITHYFSQDTFANGKWWIFTLLWVSSFHWQPGIPTCFSAQGWYFTWWGWMLYCINTWFINDLILALFLPWMRSLASSKPCSSIILHFPSEPFSPLLGNSTAAAGSSAAVLHMFQRITGHILASRSYVI